MKLARGRGRPGYALLEAELLPGICDFINVTFSFCSPGGLQFRLNLKAMN